MIKTSGNKIYKDDKEYQMRGASIADPMFFRKTDISWQQSVKELKERKANTVRFPIVPSEYFRISEKYDYMISQFIDLTRDLGLTCIISCHYREGNYSDAKIFRFWKMMLDGVFNKDHVVLEIFNEPIVDHGRDWGGPKKWTREWDTLKEYTQETIKLIREKRNYKGLIIHGTPNWCGSHNGILDNPIEDDNLAYTTHIYAGQVNNPRHRNDWHTTQTELAANYPMVITEMGFQKGSKEGGDEAYAIEVRERVINPFTMGYIFWSYSALNGFNSEDGPDGDNWEPNCVVYREGSPQLLKAGVTLSQWLLSDSREEDVYDGNVDHTTDKIKLYQFVDYGGLTSIYFLTADGKRKWNGKKIINIEMDVSKWTKTSNFIEVDDE